MENIVIKVENLSKMYTLGQTGYGDLRTTFKNFFVRNKSSANETDSEFWALQNISFEVKKGEVLGIIGGNGAGKSTLLKVLSRITVPTKGRVEVTGRIASLLEVGTGFHPELTGKENIFLNGSLLGMKKKEIIEKFDEIVDFSGVERFINTPVKHYSSGMYVRLAFSVAAHLEPEILIIDEVLAVGDVAFRKKCLKKMSEVSNTGKTIIFVSHNLNSISNLCTRGLYLQNGLIKYTGEISDTINCYLKSTLHNSESSIPIKERANRSGNGWLKFTALYLLNSAQNEIRVIASGEKLSILLKYKLNKPMPADLVVRIEFKDANGVCVFVCNSRVENGVFFHIPKEGSIVCTIPKLPLNVGQYHLDIIGKINGEEVDVLLNAIDFSVETGYFFKTGKLPATRKGVLVDHHWRIKKD